MRSMTSPAYAKGKAKTTVTDKDVTMSDGDHSVFGHALMIERGIAGNFELPRADEGVTQCP